MWRTEVARVNLFYDSGPSTEDSSKKSSLNAADSTQLFAPWVKFSGSCESCESLARCNREKSLQESYFEIQIRHEISISRKSLTYVFCNFWRPFACAFDRYDHGKDSFQIFEGFQALLHPDGTKSWFCPWSNTHTALLQSNIGCLMKISKSCSKVIRRTLWSGKILRYSSFSAISRVKRLNFRAWPNFPGFQDS